MQTVFNAADFCYYALLTIPGLLMLTTAWPAAAIGDHGWVFFSIFTGIAALFGAVAQMASAPEQILVTPESITIQHAFFRWPGVSRTYSLDEIGREARVDVWRGVKLGSRLRIGTRLSSRQRLRLRDELARFYREHPRDGLTP